MKADQVLDWVVAIIVLLFIIVPFISSLLSKKPQPKKTRQVRHRSERKNEKIKPPNEKKTMPLNLVQPKETLVEKSKLKYGSLKQAVILSEILKRPYSED